MGRSTLEEEYVWHKERITFQVLSMQWSMAFDPLINFCKSEHDPVNYQEPLGIPLLPGEHAVLCRWVMTPGEAFITMIIISGLMGVFSFHFNYGKGGAVSGEILFLFL